MTKIHPSAVVDKDAHLGDGVVIGPLCVIGSRVSIGAGTVLEACVVIEKNVEIGEKNHFFPNCVIGAWPQLLGLDDSRKIGGLVIGDNNSFHEQVTIHPSIHPGRKTQIGNNNFIMVGAHVGHDSVLGDHIVMSNCVQVSGHCKLEDGVWLSGMGAMHQFVTIGKWVYVAGLAGINKDVPPFLTVSGHYPPRIRGVNQRGMRRAGLSEEQQHRIYAAYKKLYRQGTTLLKNAENLARENGLDPNVRAILEAIDKSSQHRYGRYLELFRE